MYPELSLLSEKMSRKTDPIYESSDLSGTNIHNVDHVKAWNPYESCARKNGERAEGGRRASGEA